MTDHDLAPDPGHPGGLLPGSSSTEYLLTKLAMVLGAVLAISGILLDGLGSLAQVFPGNSQLASALAIIGAAVAVLSQVSYLVQRAMLKAKGMQVTTIDDAISVLNGAIAKAQVAAGNTAKVGLVLLLCLGVARAQEPAPTNLVYQAAAAPQAGRAVRLDWYGPGGAVTQGTWLPLDLAVRRANELEACRVFLANATPAQSGVAWYWWVLGGVALGAGGGYAATRLSQR